MLSGSGCEGDAALDGIADEAAEDEGTEAGEEPKPERDPGPLLPASMSMQLPARDALPDTAIRGGSSTAASDLKFVSSRSPPLFLSRLGVEIPGECSSVSTSSARAVPGLDPTICSLFISLPFPLSLPWVTAGLKLVLLYVPSLVLLLLFVFAAFRLPFRAPGGAFFATRLAVPPPASTCSPRTSLTRRMGGPALIPPDDALAP